MKSEVISVGTSPTPVLTTAGWAGYPMAAVIRNMSSVTVYFGDATVSTSNGFPIDANSILLSVDTVNERLYAVVAGPGNAELRLLRKEG